MFQALLVLVVPALVLVERFGSVLSIIGGDTTGVSVDKKDFAVF